MGDLKQGDHRPACCRDPDNLRVASLRENASGVLVKRQCGVCGRRHFLAEAKPQSFGVEKG